MSFFNRGLRDIELIPISLVAFAASTMLGNEVTHPGMHACLAMLVLDIILVRRLTRWSLWSILTIIVLNLGAVWAVVYQNFDGIEDWYAVACIIFSAILLLMPSRPLSTEDEKARTSVSR